MSSLIIGAGGILGRHLAELLGRDALTASHTAPADLALDLTAPPALWPALPPARAGVVCSSITSLDACFREPARTTAFNVTATIELLRRIIAAGSMPVFCSSDLVFRGGHGNYAEADRTAPTTAYGRQKKAVEDWLTEQPAPWLIVRMSKLYELSPGDASPVGSTLRVLARGETVRAAFDQVVCPTWAGDAAEAIADLVDRGARGIWHIAAPTRYSRLSLARMLAGWLRREPLVEPCRIRDFSLAEPRPRDNSLCCDKLAALGMRFRELCETDLPLFVPEAAPVAAGYHR